MEKSISDVIKNTNPSISDLTKVSSLKEIVNKSQTITGGISMAKETFQRENRDYGRNKLLINQTDLMNQINKSRGN